MSKSGAPKGRRHPMPMFDFWILFLEQLVEVKTVRAAYFKAEEIVFLRYKRRRFRSYQSFKNQKRIFYAAKSYKSKKW